MQAAKGADDKVIRQSTAQKYVREASRYLIGSRQRRSRFIQLINESISSCDDNESEIDYSELVQTLGVPKMFVENLICGTPGITLEALQAARQERRQRRIAVFFALAAAAMAVGLVLLGGFYLRYQEALHSGYTCTVMSVTQPREMTDEDFDTFMAEIDEDDRLKNRKMNDLADIKELLGAQDLSVLKQLLEDYDLSEIKELLEKRNESEKEI